SGRINSTTGYHLRWPKKNSTHCPGWVDHYMVWRGRLLKIIVVKINLSPFSFMIGQGILLNLKTKFPENCL
ncbi:hypothetical protein, partial [Pseudomonas aeruginosa]